MNELCQQAFIEAEKAFCKNKILVHYDTNAPFTLACDASKYGVRTILSHIYPDATEKIIQYAPQTLNEIQQKYAQLTKKRMQLSLALKISLSFRK